MMSDYEIYFKPVTLKAFELETGYWTNYSALTAKGIDQITVTPTISVRRIAQDLTATDLDLYFEPEYYSTEEFGLVYGDPQFLASVRSFIAKIFTPEIFGAPVYTEQGMQGDDYISMEFGRDFKIAFENSTEGFMDRLNSHPQIEAVSISEPEKESTCV